ncbi:MAG TPA: S8 family serine peptidase [Solirubrobacterales bacterium]|nr:S8 family serine peptidase [Solirubrobacterales bacterium]
MSFGLRFNRLFGCCLALAVAAVSFSASAAGATSFVPPGKGPLSPVLARLAKPAVAAEGLAAQADAAGVPRSGPGGLLREGRRLVVTARLEAGSLTALPELQTTGAEVVSTGAGGQTATLAVAPEDLEAIAAVPGVRAIWEQREPLVYGIGEGTCEGGAVVSEGLWQLRVNEAREAFGLRGSGRTVGVLSDSYNRDTGAATDAQEDVASGDLTGAANPCVGQQLPVDVVAEGPAEGGDEGRAMLQIVHDLVPEARLAFATAFLSEESFAKNIERLARPVSAGGAGADVIVDDVGWPEEPFFQDGPIAVAVNKVTSEGVSYFSAAGNDNLFDGEGHEIASWEAPEFRDAGSCPSAVGVTEIHCMDFDPGTGTDATYGITVEPESTLTLDLQWAEPWFGVESDLDAFLLDEAGQVLTESVRNNVSVGRPAEVIAWENESSEPARVQLVVNRCFATCNPAASPTAKPRLKLALLENGGGVEEVEYPVSSGTDVVGPTIFGHAGAAAAMSVGAVPFTTNSVPEEYSSRGPVRHEYGPVQGASPAPRLAAPETIEKPDFVATDCGVTTFFAFLAGGKWRFCGTSAAAPHAAAVAALMLQRNSTLAPAEVRAKLAGTARPVGSFGSDAIGAGLIDAVNALEGTSPSEPAPVKVPPDTAVPTPFQPAPSPIERPPGANVAHPETTILRHPPKLVHTRHPRVRVVFRFGSDQGSVTFLCKVDRSPFVPCSARFVRRLGPGRHVLKVEAHGAAGLTDPTPAVFRFRIVRR